MTNAPDKTTQKNYHQPVQSYRPAASACPCGSKIAYQACCEPYHCDMVLPQTPEALMRSRYTAYVLANIDYIQKTMCGKALENFNALEAKSWAQNVKWLKLKIVHALTPSENKGYVEFIARFIDKGQHHHIHEISEFQCISGKWFYVDGVPVR